MISLEQSVLEVQDFHYSYGGIHAVKGISLRVNQNEMVALIGVNGAGKTTVLNSIAGALPGREGRIRLNGVDITRMKQHAIAKLGMGHVMEGRHVFTQLTVLENLKMGAFLRRDADVIKQDIKRMYTIFPRLEERSGQLAGTLSGGEQQMLAIARALMGNPKLLLLDEPSLGIAPIVVKEIFEVIRSIREMGIAVLLVEQNSRLALSSTHRAYVMDTGTIAIEGASDVLIRDESVRRTYLGEEDPA